VGPRDGELGVVFSKIGGMFKKGDEGPGDRPRDGGGDGTGEAVFESHHIEATLVSTAVVVLVRCENVSEREATILYEETEQLLDDRMVHIVVDLRHVEVLTSAGIGALVKLHKRAEGRGGTLAVCSLNKELTDLFKLTRMDRLFALVPDRAAALAAVGS
jgi:anti-sigma B factor antagonist